eukprot:779928-Amphidinium_carterae.1
MDVLLRSQGIHRVVNQRHASRTTHMRYSMVVRLTTKDAIPAASIWRPRQIQELGRRVHPVHVNGRTKDG